MTTLKAEIMWFGAQNDHEGSPVPLMQRSSIPTHCTVWLHSAECGSSQVQHCRPFFFSTSGSETEQETWQKLYKTQSDLLFFTVTNIRLILHVSVILCLYKKETFHFTYKVWFDCCSCLCDMHEQMQPCLQYQYCMKMCASLHWQGGMANTNSYWTEWHSHSHLL